MTVRRAATAILFLLALGTIVLLQRRDVRQPIAETVTFGFNEGKPSLSPEVAQVISFGYPRVLSSLLWLRFLQYTPPEKVPRGHTSWIYYDLHALSVLDPDFKPTFTLGGVFLSVITEDQPGAERLLRRGAELFPQDPYVLGALAYHYHFEENNFERAGPLYVAAAKLPKAPYIYSLLAASYLRRRGDAKAGIELLREMAAATENEDVRKRLNAKIEKLIAQEKPLEHARH